MKDNTVYDIISSWVEKGNELYSDDELLEWIRAKNDETLVVINKSSLEMSDFWFYDKIEGVIRNKTRSFFEIAGINEWNNDRLVQSQPIIIQNEIGYLGIICQKINGILHFLMQAKIEPGNINKIQISPTIQATKSNFMQKHGGKIPAYFEYFRKANQYKIIVDQLQSEQASRFYKKRNRNIIIEVQDEITVFPNYRWMTLRQIKKFMRINNLVNMDTRTVIASIPFYEHCLGKEEVKLLEDKISDEILFRTIVYQQEQNLLPKIFTKLNDYKMFISSKIELVNLHLLPKWHMYDGSLTCLEPYSFSIIFCDILIEGREVTKWNQPLLKASGISTIGLIMCNDGDIRKFLIKVVTEIGSFDCAEMGPTIQKEPHDLDEKDRVERLFKLKLEKGEGVVFDQMLSEEGGRFYHEQNRNIIMQIDKHEIENLPAEYLWADYYTLNLLVQMNNTMNIQLRNLLALLEV